MNKTMKFRYLIAPLALAAVAFCGCQESAEYQPVIYMTDAQANPTNANRVEATPASVDISVSASEAVGRETSIVLETRPDLLEAYNATYGKAYAVLPENSYELPETTVTIKEGFITSNSVKFTVTSMEDFVEGTTYCMPVAIRPPTARCPCSSLRVRCSWSFRLRCSAAASTSTAATSTRFPVSAIWTN